MRRNKVYTFIDVFGLALSFMFLFLIGAYAWQETHIDYWHSKVDRIYALGLVGAGGEPYSTHHWAMQERLLNAFPEIVKSTAVTSSRVSLANEEIDEEAAVLWVDPSFLDIFDFELIEGDPRTALSDPNSIVLSEKLAKAFFRDASPLGKRINCGSDFVHCVVTGVMRSPRHTMFVQYDHSPYDAIANLQIRKNMGDTWIFDANMMQMGQVEVYLLGADGVDLSGKVGQYQNFMRQFQAFDDLGDKGEWCLSIFPLKSIYYQGVHGQAHIIGDMDKVKVLSAVGAVVLLFALLNYINLTVALAGKRAKEMAMRRLLGSSRTSVVWRLIGESASLCGVSMLIGAALAWVAVPYSRSVDLPLDLGACITPATVAVVLGVYVLMSVSAGIIPAMIISSSRPIDVVRGAFRRRSKMYMSKLIIVLQNCVTIAMVVCTVGMWMQVRHLINAPLGYDTSDKIIISTDGMDRDNVPAFVGEVQGLPSVKRVSSSYGNPLVGRNSNVWKVGDKKIQALTYTVDSAFVDIWGLKIIRDNGRRDGYFVTRDLLAALDLDESTPDFPYHEQRLPVAGIIEDFHTGSIISEQNPCKMLKLEKVTCPWSVVIECVGDHQEALRQVKEVYESFSQRPLDQEFYFCDQYLKLIFSEYRQTAVIVGLFAAIAIVISLLGLLAISTYYVQQRESEIAIRKVLGSASADIIWRVTLSFIAYVGVAFVIAVPLAYYVLSDWLSQFSYRIPVYWWLFAAAGVFTMLITFLAVFFQTRNAANANPIRALYKNI